MMAGEEAMALGGGWIAPRSLDPLRNARASSNVKDSAYISVDNESLSLVRKVREHAGWISSAGLVSASSCCAPVTSPAR